jgi:hypothetical protein
MPTNYESSKTYIFNVVDSSGNPQLGLTGTWLLLQGAESGISVPGSYSVLEEISNGFYKTTIDWKSVVADEGLYDGEEVVALIDWGAPLTAPERYTSASFNTRDYHSFSDTNALSVISDNVDLIKEIQTGKWEIVGTQLNLYKSDNTTLVATFDLFDKDGLATGEAPYRRVKI